jgi:N-acetylmuramoyl-L-alanine amidase
MSKLITTLIIDRGHGTCNAVIKYPTPGKQAILPNGLHVYEGFENEKYCKELARLGKEAGYEIEFTVEPSDTTDVSLTKRVILANKSVNKNNSLYISVHNNAGGGKGEGTEIFTSKGKTDSDIYAESMLQELKKVLPNRKLRIDPTDGDQDKEENFYVLKNTVMPAVLLEIGFFDNLMDYNWLSLPANIVMFSRCIINGITKANIKEHGEDKVPYKLI